MKKKKIKLYSTLLILGFALGYTVNWFSAFKVDEKIIHVKLIYDKNHKLIRQVSYRTKSFLMWSERDMIKHGIQSRKDFNGVTHIGEWRDGNPWQGSCFIMAAGDAGSVAGIGKYKAFENGIEMKN
ncbi:MAG: hypothetical protein HRT89_11520 [Lentisphaeria bacterium]|nr:hypothetical protein [Lentisphaeria bacterium]NQZ68684.1 hypothetical protein [Lentisphaeria bacterium]